jgi:hypothetical protein
MAETWSIARALRAAVRRAIARMRDHGLADRVAADEHQLVTTAARSTCSRPWMDEFGIIHCASCFGALNPLKTYERGVCPTAGHCGRPRRAGFPIAA